MKHNWEYKRLEDVFETVTDFVAAGSFADLRENVIYNSEKDYAQLVRTTDLKNKFSNNQFVYVNEHAFNYLWRVNLSKECIILPNIGNCGEVYYLHPSMLIYEHNVLGPNAIMIRSNKYNHVYLSYALKGVSFQRQLFQIVSQVAQSKFNKTNLKKLIIPIPPKETQERIVAELEDINALIEAKREQLTQLDLLAQSIFYSMFGDPITNPKGWEVYQIGDIASVQTGATPSRDNESNFIGSIPWVKTTEVQNGFIDSTEEHISEEALQNSNCKMFPTDTIIVAMYGQGKTRGQVGYLRISACTNQACAAILPSERITPMYMFNFLKASYEPLRNRAVGCNQKNLNLALIKSYEVPVPPIALQNQFAAKIEAIEAQKAEIEETLKELQTLLDSRMDYWFN